MLSWITILSVASYAYSQIRETEYECGAHGRFEYCIDGVPGCVIGCHCHPGYYFDTDTKICEPNIKLTQNFRRQYDYPEPTRIYIPPLPVTPPVPEEPATSSISPVDEKIDIITKDADDLGDWLYNQFFKTIENQLMNETKDEGTLTRRSASAPDDISKKTSRRSNKYWRARKKKKRKKHKMRSKLLRITEDDSLFDDSGDSGSDSDEDSDASDSSDSEATSNGRSESKEHKKQYSKESKHKHGKEFVVYNKRPKPPLPSFIFLPDMQTPFFPPIGLPPPAMPMYPMVPVPPVMGPYPQIPGHHTHVGDDETKKKNCGDTKNGQNESGKNSKDLIEPKDSNDKGPKKPQDPTDIKDSKESTSTKLPDTDNQNDFKEKPVNPSDPKDSKEKDLNKIDDNGPPLRMGSNSRGRARNKFMQSMREKLKRKNNLQNVFATEYQEPPQELPSESEPPANCPTLPELKQHKTLPKYDLRNELSKLQDVDFKYLSQLIHKADLNKTNSFSPYPKDHETNPAVNPSPEPSRRIYNDINSDGIYQPPPNQYGVDQVLYNLNNVANETLNSPANHLPNQQPPYFNKVYKNPYRKKIEATNDTYYANLGRQIAAMIRNIDADKEVDIEIEKSNKGEPMLNRISQGSRSYWDRAVRSPNKTVNTRKNILYRKNINRLKKSNEDLYSLENKVEIAASTKPTLGLNELENIVSKMERARSSLTRIKHNEDIVRATSSKTSFNVNLLPGNYHTYFANRIINNESLVIPPKYISFNTSAKKENIEGSPLLLEPQKSLITKRFFKEFNVPSKIVIHKKETTTEINTTRLSVVPSNKTKIFRPLRHKTPYNNNYYTVLPQPFFPNMKFIKDTASKTHYHELNPMVLNRKSFNFYPNKNNQYVYEKASVPVRYPTIPKQNQARDSSYFHHELHHFDYFDDLF